MKLDGRSVVITGGGSGVGRASALLFAAQGARVVVADVNDDWAADTVSLVTEAGGTAVAVHCDVSVEDDVEHAIAAAVREYGRLDVMYNNAGITGFTPGQSFADQTEADWERLAAVNVKGVFLGCKHAVRQFGAQGDGGVIVNTGSIAGMVGYGSVLYGATKGAVNQLTRGVAVEYAAAGIRCNAVCPGTMPDTNFLRVDDTLPFQPHSDEYVQYAASFQPNGRVISPADCAAAALFLACDDSRNITGVLLPVDGGFTAR